MSNKPWPVLDAAGCGTPLARKLEVLGDPGPTPCERRGARMYHQMRPEAVTRLSGRLAPTAVVAP